MHEIRNAGQSQVYNLDKIIFQLIQLISFALVNSEQQIVDCDFADRRCGGGSYHEYWKSLIRAGGQAHSAGYPYVSGATKVRGPTCKNKSKGAKLAATNPIVALQKGDVNGVMRLLARGKVVAVCVGVTDKFMNYRYRWC